MERYNSRIIEEYSVLTKGDHSNKIFMDFEVNSLSKKCRYGRDSLVTYLDVDHKEKDYKCIHDGEADLNDFCIFHSKEYWKQNKDCEKNVRKAFLEEFEKAKNGTEVLCIGYYLPKIDVEGDSDSPIIVKGKINFGLTTFQELSLKNIEFSRIHNYDESN